MQSMCISLSNMFIFADNQQRTTEVTTMKLRNVQLQQAQNAPNRLLLFVQESLTFSHLLLFYENRSFRVYGIKIALTHKYLCY